jgi:hypothetical protein
MRFLRQTGGTHTLGELLQGELSDPRWTTVRAAVAFVKYSGVRHLVAALAAAADRGSIQLAVGIDHQGSSVEGLTALMKALPAGSVLVTHNRNRRATFHPKLWLFHGGDVARVIVGSGNLTGGGLFTNYEAGWVVDLRLDVAAEQAVYDDVVAMLDAVADTSTGLARVLDDALLGQLAARKMVLPEVFTVEGAEGPSGSGGSGNDGQDKAAPLFPAIAVPLPPATSGTAKKATASKAAAKKTAAKKTAAKKTVAKKAVATTAAASPYPFSGLNGFLMTLTNTDVGHGQTTPGTQRRSPEIFIPLRASRDANPEFWGFPHLFTPDPAWTKKVDREGRGKLDRHGVRFLVGGQVVEGTIWYNPNKGDIRIRSEELRSRGSIGDLLRMEAAPPDSAYDYLVDFVSPNDSLFGHWDALCNRPIGGNSPKRYGYYGL